jgi:hypothetical protein
MDRRVRYDREGPPMRYPDRLQATLLFDGRMEDIASMARDFVRIETMRSGATFAIAETDPGLAYRLLDAEGRLAVTLEHRRRPPELGAIERALSSACVGILTPDIRARIAGAHTQIVIEASHEAADEDGESAEAEAGASLPQFERRLAVLALIARICIERAMPLAVHWSQSDLLLSGEKFDALAAPGPLPGPLHVHPLLFGPPSSDGEAAPVGIRTFGARHWLGREIIVQPGVVPWAESHAAILAFLAAATGSPDAVPADGSVFAPESCRIAWRVRHHEAGADIGYAAPEPAELAMIELAPLATLAEGAAAVAAPAEEQPPSAPAPAPPRQPTRPGLPRFGGRGPGARLFGRKGT